MPHLSSLQLATDGCCKGHLCDNCRICQSGHCCRRDNPNYKLPEEGEWDGPAYGTIGVLVDDGTRVECHCCGESFKHLGFHIWSKHDLTGNEYKAIFGLMAKTALCSSDLSKDLRRLAEQHPRPDTSQDNLMLTPEQRSAYSKNRRVSTEWKTKTEKWPGCWAETACVICGSPIRQRSRKIGTERQKKTCSRRCRYESTRRNLNAHSGHPWNWHDPEIYRRPLYDHTCAICGKAFSSENKDVKTCSKSCKHALIGKSHAGQTRPLAWREHMAESITAWHALKKANSR